MNENDMVKTNHDFVVTETTIDPKLSADLVVKFLRERRTTGQLVFHLSQGGLQKVSLVEKTKASGSQSTQIRELLGWK